MKDEKNPLVKYSDLFNKQRKSLPIEIRIAFIETRDLFLEEPNHPGLRNHALKKRFEGYRSIDVTDDYRAIYRKRMEGEREIIYFYMIGTHKELYGK